MNSSLLKEVVLEQRKVLQVKGHASKGSGLHI